jgi:hypothetical protein
MQGPRLIVAQFTSDFARLDVAHENIMIPSSASSTANDMCVIVIAARQSNEKSTNESMNGAQFFGPFLRIRRGRRGHPWLRLASAG